MAASQSTPTFLISNINHLFTIKLDSTNYTIWRQQFLPILNGLQLTGYIDDTKPCPDKFLLNSEGQLNTTVNPLFLEWQREDQNLLAPLSLLVYLLMWLV
ncbi:hypothetical protein QJS04_geneDACA016156 [Acorus gramineus]|uniref:Retrotransposon Copia-like N-terminal domain-containing protein n=1 Tax=Acorus gramineus TaxID=55184 RepID=A0AAV9ALT8_ACOGR|nr:hypothetical protein QJS04_geneDACA016156 [Acorus gramineus]